MKNIKKIAVLVTAIGAMAALAVPSMASAKVWGPMNTNQTLSTAGPVNYRAQFSPTYYNYNCTGHQLGVHVRTPASSTLDVTSASWTSCAANGVQSTCSVSMAPVGLPWTAVSTAGGVTITEHVQATYSGGAGCWAGSSGTVTELTGTIFGTWDAATHRLKFTNSVGLDLSYMGTLLDHMDVTATLSSPSLTLT